MTSPGWRLVAAVALLPGCFDPARPAVCERTDECAEGQICANGRCQLTPPVDAPDADAPDAPGPSFVPSNGIDPEAANVVSASTTIAMATTFDSDTGQISGGLTRAGTQGVAAGIAYVQAPASGPNGVPLGVFVFGNLTVEMPAVVHVTGTRALVLLVRDAAQIDGVLDVSGGGITAELAGPGGGAGGTASAPATGCGPGSPGQDSGGKADGGGGGGGGSSPGGPGGNGHGNDSTLAIGGAGGMSCLPATLEPLQGGSGGGTGPGIAGGISRGGGGGGALQITALRSLTITGTLSAGGAGGDGGGGAIDPASDDASAGGGGGGGGALLLEAPTLILTETATLAANGGGGGGGGNDRTSGLPGGNANASDVTAMGGVGATTSNDGPRNSGGAGGAATSAAQAGGGPVAAEADIPNGGGGGGAAGQIVVRARSLTVAGISSPAALKITLPANATAR